MLVALTCGRAPRADRGGSVHRQQRHVRLPAVLREDQTLAEGVVRHPREGERGALPLRRSAGKNT